MKKSEFMIATGIGALSLALVIANIVMVGQNRQAQAESASRAQFIQQSVQLEVLYMDIVKALADLAVRNQDQDLKNVLNAQGISVSPPPGPDAGARK